MNADQVRNYFLSCPEAIEDFPFGNEVHVFKIRKKMFGFLAYREGFTRVNLKCDPDETIMLRRRSRRNPKSGLLAAGCCLVLCTPALEQELVCRKPSQGLLGT